MDENIEYIQLFMEYESDDMPVVYFNEVSLMNDRMALREIEVFANRTVILCDDPYCDVIEECPIPTIDELNAEIWGEGFCAAVISKLQFDEIWNTGIYNGSLSPA